MNNRVELKIIHKQLGKDLGRYRVASKDEVIVVGSSPNARIRIIDDKVCSIHACIEFRNNHWHVIDFSGNQGTKVDNKPIHEMPIVEDMTLAIGGAELLIQPVRIASYKLYTKDNLLKLNNEFGTLVPAQQVVIFRHSKIISSEIIKPGKKIKLGYQKENHKFSPAIDESWLEDQIGDVRVRRRNIIVPIYKESKSHKIGNLITKDTLYSFGLAAVIGALFFLTIWWSDKVTPKETKLQKNKYTQMIFDAEVIKKQRKAAKKIKKKVIVKKKNKVAKKKKPLKKKPASLAKKSISKKAKKALDRLKKSGLSRKISKIASISSISNAALLKSAQKGVSKSRNKAFNSGSVILSKKKKFNKNVKSYNVKSVSTKKINAKDTKRLSGLSATNVGRSGLVGAIEEETEISAGMDPEIIRSIVKKSMGRIRYCYERQLITSPGISGQIKLSWTINSQGRVVSPKIVRTTMKSAMVEGCIARVIKRLNFPRPDSGGNVLVSFPFYFKAGS